MSRTIVGFGGGGGSGFSLGPVQNTFGTSTTANESAAETLRNTYATANAAWLAEYNADRSFYIQLVWTGGAESFQRQERRRDRLGRRDVHRPRSDGYCRGRRLARAFRRLRLPERFRSAYRSTYGRFLRSKYRRADGPDRIHGDAVDAGRRF